MSEKSLADVLQTVASPVELLRNSQIGPYAFPVVRHEFTNWRDEQRSWRETCALFDQSHHMTDLYVKGPDALKLFSDLGVNTFKNFKVNQAKQFVACNHDGYVIGDAILFYLDENSFNLVGRPPAANWVQFNVETGGYNATAERDERSAVNQGKRKAYRYQVQGPHALKVMEKVTGKTRPRHPLLQYGCVEDRRPRCPRSAPRDGGTARMGTVRSLGRWRGSARRHRRSRAGIWYPAGRRPDLSHQLSRIRLDSFAAARHLHRREMKAYRQWLKSTSYEAMASLGGSFYSE